MDSSPFWMKYFEETANVAEQKIVSKISPNQNQKEIDKIVEVVTSNVSGVFIKDLKRNVPKILKERQGEQDSFNKRLYKLWKKPLKLLKILLILSEEIGRYYNAELRPKKAKENDIVFDVLIRLHARSTLIGKEIFTLLCNGYASGADARWRSLHETVVFSFFIAEHGDEVAEKYILHESIESYKAMLQYNKYAERLKSIPFSEKEVEGARKITETLSKRYGKSFCNQYGWAATELGKKDPNFWDIEEKTGLDHWQPYYKMASHPIHANSKGIIFNLGLNNSKGIMLAGPSNAGLEEPGRKTAISLSQINSIFSTIVLDYLSLVIAKSMLHLLNEIEQNFIEVSQEFKDDLL
jgi:hypothetical protein